LRQFLDGFERVDLFNGFVGAPAQNAWKAQGEAAFVAIKLSVTRSFALLRMTNSSVSFQRRVEDWRSKASFRTSGSSTRYNEESSQRRIVRRSPI